MTAHRRNMSSAEIRNEALAKIAQFSEPNREIAKRVHSLIMEAEPTLQVRLWYGMPGYARTKDGPVLCFFREDEKYMTFGLTEKLDITQNSDTSDKFIPCAWFFTELDTATEIKLKKIVQAYAKG